VNTLIRVDDLIINLATVTRIEIAEIPEAPTVVDVFFVGDEWRRLTGKQADRFLNAVMRQTGNW
jgi:hypothetical protein